MKGELICVMLVAAMVEMMMVEPGEAAVNCGQVQSNLSKCVPYLIGQAAQPDPACCDGVRKTKAMVPTTELRRQACDCIKAIAAKFKNLKDGAASQLPSKCHVQLNIPISRTVNCKTIP